MTEAPGVEYSDDESFMRVLARRFPEFQQFVDDDFNQHEDGFLAYLAIADAARLVAEHWQGGHRARAKEVLDYLEESYAAGSTVRDLIGAGFMEALPLADGIDNDFAVALGPNLRRLWDFDNQ